MTERKLPPGGEFDKELSQRAGLYGTALTDVTRSRLREYFEMVSAWNARLHLVAPCTPGEFASRHVLESLAALPFIGEGASFVDVGSGAGLPAVPCLVVRTDLCAVLVESSRKKSVFLREAASRLGLRGRAQIFADRFQNIPEPEADALTCRALERFADLLPEIFYWARGVGTLLLFGGEGLEDGIRRAGRRFERVRLPQSERRFLYVVGR